MLQCIKVFQAATLQIQIQSCWTIELFMKTCYDAKCFLSHNRDDLDLGYVNPRGHHLLRKEISGMYGVPAENVLVCAPQEGVMIGTRPLVKYCQK